jgi:hypothetical protein
MERLCLLTNKYRSEVVSAAGEWILFKIIPGLSTLRLCSIMTLTVAECYR